MLPRASEAKGERRLRYGEARKIRRELGSGGLRARVIHESSFGHGIVVGPFRLLPVVLQRAEERAATR
jgi:hypothetical protein